MKKLTKLHFILIILLLVVLATTVYFSFSYRGAQAKQPDIKSEIVQALAQLEIIREENNPEPWEKKLAEVQSVLKGLQRERPLFPERPATVEIGDLIVDTVERLDLTLLRLKSELKDLIDGPPTCAMLQCPLLWLAPEVSVPFPDFPLAVPHAAVDPHFDRVRHVARVLAQQGRLWSDLGMPALGTGDGAVQDDGRAGHVLPPQ